MDTTGTVSRDFLAAHTKMGIKSLAQYRSLVGGTKFIYQWNQVKDLNELNQNSAIQLVILNAVCMAVFVFQF